MGCLKPYLIWKNLLQKSYAETGFTTQSVSKNINHLYREYDLALEKTVTGEYRVKYEVQNPEQIKSRKEYIEEKLENQGDKEYDRSEIREAVEDKYDEGSTFTELEFQVHVINWLDENCDFHLNYEMKESYNIFQEFINEGSITPTEGRKYSLDM